MTTQLHLTPRLKKEHSYTSAPLWAFTACCMVNFVFLYECGTWPLAWTEECGLKVFGSKELWKIFGPENDEVKGGEKDENALNPSRFVLLTKYCSSDETKKN